MQGKRFPGDSGDMDKDVLNARHLDAPALFPLATSVFCQAYKEAILFSLFLRLFTSYFYVISRFILSLRGRAGTEALPIGPMVERLGSVSPLFSAL